MFMNVRHWFCLLLTGAAFVAAPSALLAQRGVVVAPDRGDEASSHVPIPRPGGDLEAQLAERLGRSQQRSELQKLLKQFMEMPGGPEALHRLGLSGAVDLNDPEVKKQVGELLGKYGPELIKKDPSLTKEQLNKLKEELSKPVAKEGGGPSTGGSTGNRPPAERPSDAVPVPRPNTNTKRPDSGRKINQLAQRLQEYVKTFQQRASAIGQSSAFQRAASGFARLAQGEGLRKPRTGGTSASLPSPAGGNGPSAPRGDFRLDQVGTSLGNLLPFKGSFSLPSLPGFKWPFGSSSGSLPSVGGVPSLGGLSGGTPQLWGGLLWLIAAGILAATLWRLFAWRSDVRQRRRQGDGWSLGPWPVNPAAVRTREDLIKAFEHLSLLLLGRPAQSWNHRQIADGMGQSPASDGSRHRVANELAGLYEVVRYAPPEGPLTETDLAAARRDLCYLAGVSVA
jgi:hypothetical protein